MSTYHQLLADFFAAVALSLPEDVERDENGLVEFTAGNLIVRIYPHLIADSNASEPNAVVLEADLMLLDFENIEVNHNRFLILHQLNAVSRLTTGIIVFISEEGMLSISKIISMTNLSGEKLAEEVAALIESAEHLYDGWHHLADLAEKEKSNSKLDIPISDMLKG